MERKDKQDMERLLTDYIQSATKATQSSRRLCREIRYCHQKYGNKPYDYFLASYESQNGNVDTDALIKIAKHLLELDLHDE